MNVSIYEPGCPDREIHEESRVAYTTEYGKVEVYVEHGHLVVRRSEPYYENLAVIPHSSNVIKVAV